MAASVAPLEHSAGLDDSALEQARITASRALQLPLSLLSTKDEFRAELGQIAAIVENANPEDPRMLAIEVEAHKVCCRLFCQFQDSLVDEHCL